MESLSSYARRNFGPYRLITLARPSSAIAIERCNNPPTRDQDLPWQHLLTERSTIIPGTLFSRIGNYIAGIKQPVKKDTVTDVVTPPIEGRLMKPAVTILRPLHPHNNS